MFPIRDENPTIRTSIATFVLIAANVAVWVFVQGFGFELGVLLITVSCLGLLLPMLTILFIQKSPFRSH